MNKTIKSIVYSLIAAVFVIGAISGFFIWDHARKEASLNETLETLTLKTDESLLDIEYGDSFDPASVITSHEGDMKISGTVDPKTPGDQTFTVTLSKEDQFHQTAEKEFTFTAHVKDTKKPEIRFTEESFVFPESAFSVVIFPAPASSLPEPSELSLLLSAAEISLLSSELSAEDSSSDFSDTCVPEEGLLSELLSISALLLSEDPFPVSTPAPHPESRSANVRAYTEYLTNFFIRSPRILYLIIL